VTAKNATQSGHGYLGMAPQVPSTSGGSRDGAEPMSIIKIDGEHSLTF
jgi:hypothetical protein